MRKNILFGLLCVSMLFFVSTKFSYAAGDEQLTNLKFAQVLAEKLNVELPVGIENLSPQDYYQALVDALAARGITSFEGSGPTGVVTCAKMADVLYGVTGGKENMDTKAKIQNLVCKGCFFSCGGPGGDISACANKVICTNTEQTRNLVACVNPNAVATLANLEENMDTPCIGVIAEAYTPPERPFFPPPPPRIPENPASQQ